MGKSQDSASTRLWLGIFWPTRTRFYKTSQDSDSIELDFLRLELARTQSITTTDRSKSRLGIDSTLTWHFLADSYSILLDESRLGLNRARLFKTRTGLDSTHHYYWWVQVKTWHQLDSDSAFFGRLILNFARRVKTWTRLFPTRPITSVITSACTYWFWILITDKGEFPFSLW